MKRKRFLFIITILFFNAVAFRTAAQNDSAKLYDMAFRAAKQYDAKAYNNALEMYLSALDLIKKSNQFNVVIASQVLNALGDCYDKANDVVQAHRYYTEALQNARKYFHQEEKESALLSLINLHREIVIKNIPFPYPAVAETEEDELFASIGNIEHKGDSLRLTLLAGRFDGIVDSTFATEIFTHYTNADSISHNDINFFGSAKIIKIGDNNTIVTVKNNPAIKLLVGDLATLRVRVPLQWRKFFLRSYLLDNLFLKNNNKQLLYHYRYFYYFGDSLAERDVQEAMKTAVDEVVDMLGEDTLNDPTSSQKARAGIFAGINMMKAMKISKPEHLRLFLDFVKNYPGKYVGNDYKFAETYATWIINDTPLDPDDIKPWLLNISSTAERRRVAFDLKEGIVAENLTDKWLDEGMQQVNIENIAEARKTATLLNDVATALHDTLNSGWSDYLFANIEKRMSNDSGADSLLTNAENKFITGKNKEGETWINDTRLQWKKANKIVVGVQNGHLFPFVIAQSNNPRYFATGGRDNLVKIWDRYLGKEILTLNDHRDEINSLHYSPNGRYLISASEDSTICIWNAYTYSLVHKYKTASPERTAIFSPDNKFIVSAGKDSLIKFRDLQTGEIVKTLKLHKGTVYDLYFHPVLTDYLYSCGADSMIYKWDMSTGEMVHWYKQKGKVLSIKLSNDGKHMSAVTTDSLLSVWNTETNRKEIFGKINVYSLGITTNYSSETFSADSRYIAFSYSRDSFDIIDLQNLYERVYATNLDEFTLADMQFSNDGLSLFARFDLGGPLRIYNFAGWDIRNNTTISWKDIKQFSNLPVAVQFTKDDNDLVIVHNQISELDLRTGHIQQLAVGPGLIENNHLLIKNDKLGTRLSLTEPTIYFYDLETKNVVQSFSLPLEERISAVEISPDDKYCFLGSKKGLISGWNTVTGKQLFSRNYINGDDAEIYRLHYDQYRNRLYVISAADNILCIDPDKGNITDSLVIKGGAFITASAQYIYVTTDNGWLYKYDGASLKFIKKIQVNNKGEIASQAVLTPDKKILLVQNTFSSLLALQTSNDSILYNIYDHDFGGTMIAVSNDNRMVATSGADSRVNLFETATGKKIVSIHMPLNKDVMIADEQGHYLASKNTLDAILFTYNNNAYTFDQFDVQLNRPDLVLEKIGKADTVLLKAYYAAWKKRISRLNVDEKNIGMDVHLPLLRLQDKFAVQPITTQKEFELNIECTDSRYPLQSLHILVNNSPLLGVAGKNLLPLNTQSIVQKINVPLSNGSNTIKVYCTNSKGVASLTESFTIISKYKAEQEPKVYFIGIGVADYKDSRMNLTYPAKDIRDLAVMFSNLYENISIDTLINNKATRENILALKKKLMQTTVNDRVIMAVTGHGLLSDSLDFYYATWDINAGKPQLKGLKYEDLENLLTDIPARQKLMLIDACHSGALDKDELLALKKNNLSADSAKNKDRQLVRVIGSPELMTAGKAARLNANSSFEMMQNLFTDLSSGNGSIIISAAGGMEYAFEWDKWNNGLFTYCVRKGIEERAADFETGNSDGKVSVQELLNYVSQKVNELSDGKQKPTSRRENIDYEWMIRN